MEICGLEGDDAWRNLAALSDLVGPAGQDGADGQDGQDGADGQDGQDGADGREVELQVSNGYIQWRYEGGTWSNLVDLSTLTGAAGQDKPRVVRMARMVRDGADGQDGEGRVTPSFRINPDTTSGRCPTMKAPPGIPWA